MTTEPLISPEMFDYLRRRGIEPYTKLDDSVREHLGDGVRLLNLFADESFTTRKTGQRITVLSGQVLMRPGGVTLDLEGTRGRMVVSRAGETQLVARENSVVLLADVEFLDTLSSWVELAAHARQSGGEELALRLLRVKHRLAFRSLPLEHVEEALKRMVSRKVKAGETIVNQGERGDAFYLLWSGRAEVWRSSFHDDPRKMVDTLVPGDVFGDEALVTGGNRNASVTMSEDGELLVLGEQDFRELLSRPLIEEVAAEQVPALINSAWRPLDVRYAEEYAQGHIPGAIPLPLPDLRARADEVLHKTAKYIAVCQSGKLSSVAAYLLKQRGYTVVVMKGGMAAWPGGTAG